MSDKYIRIPFVNELTNMSVYCDANKKTWLSLHVISGKGDSQISIIIEERDIGTIICELNKVLASFYPVEF